MAATTNSSTKSSCKILPCTCNLGQGAEFQDRKYGIGKRVHNPTNKGYKCTICSSVKSRSGDDN